MATQSVSPALLRLPTVCSVVGLSKSQIYRLIKSGQFPAAIQLGTNSVAWPAEHINAWVAEKISASRV